MTGLIRIIRRKKYTDEFRVALIHRIPFDYCKNTPVRRPGLLIILKKLRERTIKTFKAAICPFTYLTKLLCKKMP
jgi:hypothetical protein